MLTKKTNGIKNMAKLLCCVEIFSMVDFRIVRNKITEETNMRRLATIQFIEKSIPDLNSQRAIRYPEDLTLPVLNEKMFVCPIAIVLLKALVGQLTDKQELEKPCAGAIQPALLVKHGVWDGNLQCHP